MKKWLTLVIAIGLGACSENTEDDARLASYKAALPSRAALAAPEGTAQASTRAVGDVALFPASSVPVVTGINGTVGWVIDTLEAVTDLPPTVFNSDSKEYLWGPFENDDGVGFISVYIRENEPDADFAYTYAFVRGIDRDIANASVIIAGGATPLNPESDDPSTSEDNEFGSGILLVDFDADLQFDLTNDPTTDEQERDRGKFVAVFGRGPDEDTPEATLAMVVAAFRNFVPAGESTAPAAVDYLYGEYENQEVKASFLNYRLPIDVTEDGEVFEDTEVQIAFVNDGFGRAEVTATNGSLMAGESINATECWGDQFDRTYLDISTNVAGGYSYTEGVPAGCVAPFDTPLDDLDIPSLADIDQDDYQELEDLAENGLE
ncbi:MAG: hypothetical protein AAFY60_05680 [Myxococcota bacterium]